MVRIKILLVKPPSKWHQVIPPLGLGYLASTLEREHEVEILDCVKEKADHAKFGEIISNENPEVVGFAAFTSDMNSVRKCAEIVKEIDRNTLTVVGGAHPSGDPHGTLDYLQSVDYAMVGECEEAFPLFLRNKNTDTPNLVYRKNGGVACNNRIFPQDLDSLSCAWHLIRPEEYPELVHSGFYRQFPVCPIITSRGCPYSCTFCAGHRVTGKKVRLRSPRNVVDEIKYLHNEFGINEIHIEDDNFTVDRKRVQKICSLLIDEHLDITWCCPSGVRLDSLDRETLELMKKAGCYSIAVGIESGSERILKLMKKNLTLETIEKQVRLADEVGLEITGFFILGYPSEREDEINKTIEFSNKLPLDKAQFSLFMPLPGSEIYEELQLPKITDYDKYVASEVSYSEIPNLKDFQRKAFFSFYARPRIFFKTIGQIRSLSNVRALLKRIWDYTT